MAGGDKGGSKKGRTRGAALERRLDVVEDLIVRACSFREIRVACAIKWKLSPRQADEYVAKVHERWASERAADRPRARAQQLRRVMRIVRKAIDGKDLRTALAAEALLVKLEGTEYRPSDDLDAGGGTEVVFDIDDESEADPEASP